MGVQQDVSQLDDFIHLPEIDSEFQKTLDLGRTYYYHKEIFLEMAGNCLFLAFKLSNKTV